MLEFIIGILGTSLVFYVIFAGADFGAGIYEFLSDVTKNKSRKKLVERAIGPIWEANHMWLILAIVIFFMGFPEAFAQFSTIFHIPIVMILVGISLRGTAFAFRHYDSIQDEWQKRYTWLFGVSSVWTAFWQGVVVGALFGDLPSKQTDFYSTYVHPWFTPFSFCTGLFVIAVYLYLAQTFFLSETDEYPEMAESIEKDVWKSLLFVFITGGLVFIAAWLTQPKFFSAFFGHPVSVTLLIITTLLLVPLIKSYRSKRFHWARFLVAVQVAFIFLAVFIKRFPVLLSFNDGSNLSYSIAAAPEATLRQLTYALAVGVTVVLPFLIYLLKVFKSSTSKKKRAT
ncbi:MAG: cytochrome d ubiquinol oxidase subunit II [Rhizobacter sp.]|nr:cytochrome d ubiquinol oxidase subunit II [Bacteriovorax sp.]